MKNEVARPKVILDGKQAEQELDNLTAKAKKYRDAMLEATAAGDTQTQKRLQQQLKATNTEIRNLKKEAFDVDRVLKNINGASFNELSQAVRKATNDLKKMQQTDPGYQAQQQKVVALKTKLGELSNEQKAHTPLWSRMAEGANNYFSIITAGAASLAGLVLGMKQVVQSFNDYEERVDNLSALTGLAGDDLDWLNQKAKDLSTSTLEGNIRVKQSAQDIVDAFTKTGSARPELLKNKEALAETTQEAIILANAAKTELYPAIEALTMVMNQYNVPASEARRIINVLAAGSKEGAGEIPYLTTAYEKAGTVAALANISIETLGATIETLAPRITQPEIAGRSLKGVLIDMQTGADDTNPAIVGLSTALENLGKKNLSVTELTKKFGTENIATIQILLTNIEELKRYEKAMTGTNVAIEQAAINTDNNNAKLAQARNRINVTSIALGEKLAPAMTLVTGYFGKSLAILSYLVDVFIKYSGVIFTSTSAIIGYTVATKLATFWQEFLVKQKSKSIIIGEIEYSLTLKSIIARKLETLAINAQIAVTQLWAAAQMLLTGNIKGATQAMRVFSAVTKLNPIGLLIGIITAAVIALSIYSRKLTDVQQAQKAINDVNIEAQKAMVEEKVKLDQLLKIAKNKNLSDETRRKAIKDINALSPELLGNLTLEKINTDEAKKSTDEYIESIKNKAKAQAGFQKLVDIEKELIDLENGKGAEPTFWQDTWNSVISGSNSAAYAANTAGTIMDNYNEKTKALILTKKKLTEQMDSNQKSSTVTPGSKPAGGDDKAAEDKIKLKEKELQTINERIAITDEEIAARNRDAESIEKEIARLKELGTTKQGNSGEKLSDAAIKKQIEIEEAAYNAKLTLIKKNHLETKGSEDQYNAEILKAEFDFLQEKLTIYKKGSKEYEETQTAFLEKQVQAEQNIKNLILAAQKELTNAKIENLQDGIAKEKAIEEQRWSQELDGLWKQLIIKENLSKEEEALNDIINQTIEEKQAAHLKKMAQLDKAEELRKKQKIADKFNSISQNDTSIPFVSIDTLQSYFDNRKSLLDQQYEYEKTLAGDNHTQLLAAEERYHDRVSELNKNEAEAYYSTISRKIEWGQAYMGALATIFGQESALGKAMFLFSQGLAVADVWIKAAAANAAIVSTALAEFAWLGPGAPAAAAAFAAAPLAANNTNAALQTGLIVAQTIGSFVTGYASGGYTNGDRIYRAGEEGTEFIGNAKSVQNPTVKKAYDIIRLAQEDGTIAQLNLSEVLSATGKIPVGRQNGLSGNNLNGASNTPIIVQGSASPDPAFTDAINLNTKAIALLMKRGVSFPMVSGIKKMREVEDLLNQTGMGGFGK